MRVRSTHTRDLDAPSDEVGRLVAALGSDRDVLWPHEFWPGTPIEFDRPLGPGASGGHGTIRYAVEAYEPGRRLLFRFDPGTGIDGTHGFDLEPLEDGRTRLVHTLNTRLVGAVRMVRPLLLRMHDTMIGQLLDNAVRATGGRVEHPTRIALWMRALNAVEARFTRGPSAHPVGDAGLPG